MQDGVDRGRKGGMKGSSRHDQRIAMIKSKDKDKAGREGKGVGCGQEEDRARLRIPQRWIGCSGLEQRMYATKKEGATRPELHRMLRLDKGSSVWMGGDGVYRRR